MARKTGDYHAEHIEWLKDPENAAGYLNAVIEEEDKDALLFWRCAISRRQREAWPLSLKRRILNGRACTACFHHGVIRLCRTCFPFFMVWD